MSDEKPSATRHSEKIDFDASRRRAWYDKARIWLREYDQEVRRPLMVDVVVDELATLYRAYIQTYEASYFAPRSHVEPLDGGYIGAGYDFVPSDAPEATPSSTAARKTCDEWMEEWEAVAIETGLPQNWRDRLTITLRGAKHSAIAPTKEKS